MQDVVSRAHADHNLVALGAVMASREGLIDIAVAGRRASNAGDPVLSTDAWHLGSNTKALTALLYAQLVERGLVEWGAPLPALFPDLVDEMDPAWNDVTIEDLFAHRSGMMQMGGFWLGARRSDERAMPIQRMEAAKNVLTRPPSKTPGAFDYNNLNYIVAGAAMESVLRGRDDLPGTWEDAMQALLFDTLGSEAARTGFGYGPPPQGLEGHRALFGLAPNPVGRGSTADNPAVLGPAGTLHATLEAHATLAIEFLKDDSSLIPVHMREKLFEPHPDEASGYAMGWGVYDHATYGRLFLHSGSNTMWTSRITIAPNLDRVIIVNTNQFSDAARKAIDTVTVEMLDQAMSDQLPE
nr:serine hydrolase domain-containing protein [Hyphomonas sp. Mor2]